MAQSSYGLCGPLRWTLLHFPLLLWHLIQGLLLQGGWSQDGNPAQGSLFPIASPSQATLHIFHWPPMGPRWIWLIFDKKIKRSPFQKKCRCNWFAFGRRPPHPKLHFLSLLGGRGMHTGGFQPASSNFWWHTLTCCWRSKSLEFKTKDETIGIQIVFGLRLRYISYFQLRHTVSLCNQTVAKALKKLEKLNSTDSLLTLKLLLLPIYWLSADF